MPATFNRMSRPGTSSWARNTLLVQTTRYLLSRQAPCVLEKNPANDSGLAWIDRALTANWSALVIESSNHVVAVGVSTWEPSFSDQGLLTTTDLIPGFDQIELIHRPS